MSNAIIDVSASAITLRTRATGMLARLAHDLEISAGAFEAELQRDGDKWQATLTFPVDRLTVVGALRHGRVDRSILSDKDRHEIERKLREEVLVGAQVVVRAAGSDSRSAEVEVMVPSGVQRLRVALQSDPRQDGGSDIIGKLSLSLKALHIREVKAPLGAFKVDDTVEVAFVVVLPNT
ncbi:MAG TPA: hypothetical protein ENK23_04285, partial [Sorangium sp.]|nr:hypothetical protein [Sorangium sp.]